MLEGVVANIRNNLTVLSYNIYLHPPAGLLLFTQAIAVAILFAYLPMHSTYSDNLILLNFTAVTILGEEYSLLLLSLLELYPSVVLQNVCGWIGIIFVQRIQPEYVSPSFHAKK
jgi:hypothetical protein